MHEVKNMAQIVNTQPCESCHEKMMSPSVAKVRKVFGIMRNGQIHIKCEQCGHLNQITGRD